MMKHSLEQNGSALVILVIIVSASLLGGLSFVLWQNSTTSKDSSVQEQSVDSSKVSSVSTDSDRRTYKNDQFSFNYPAKGWAVGEIRYVEGTPLTTELKSDDYQQSGMGVDKGAIISVNVNEKSASLDDEYAELQKEGGNFGVEDLRKTTVAGMASVTYHSAYEGDRHHTIFVHGGKRYDIVYQYNSDASTYMDTYTLVTSSFRFI